MTVQKFSGLAVAVFLVGILVLYGGWNRVPFRSDGQEAQQHNQHNQPMQHSKPTH